MFVSNAAVIPNSLRKSLQVVAKANGPEFHSKGQWSERRRCEAVKCARGATCWEQNDATSE